jgi:allantoinase
MNTPPDGTILNGETAMLDLLIVGDAVWEGQVHPGAGIGVREGRIAGWFEAEYAPPARERVDAKGLLILPGFIDAHVHCASTPFEGVPAASAAAAAGGITTVVDMPFDAPAGVSTVEQFAAKMTRIKEQTRVDCAMLAAVKKETLGEIAGLAAAGACGYKMSLYDTDPERFPIVPDSFLLEAFRRVAQTGLHAGVHAENDQIVQETIRQFRGAGRVAPRDHCLSRPPISEIEATLRACEFARETGVRLHIHHVSLPRCIELVQRYRLEGIRVTAETCPHYLLLTIDDMERLKAKAKINPPLRERADVEGLWADLAAGRIDFVASDHAPWPPESKTKSDIFDNGSGAPGVQTMAPLLYSEGVAKGRISLGRFVEVLSKNVARTFNLPKNKGELLPGADADLVLFDPKKRWVVRDDLMLSNARWSPFEGMAVQGAVISTLVRGTFVYRDGQLLAKPGEGRFVAGTASLS